jgi:large subunit ribosomal protein L28
MESQQKKWGAGYARPGTAGLQFAARQQRDWSPRPPFAYCIAAADVLLCCYAQRRCLQMAKCSICGKGVAFGITVSHSHRRSNRMFKPNVKRVKALVGGSPCHIHACTRCLRSGKVTRAV